MAAPQGVCRSGSKKAGARGADVAALGPEMVVDDVEHDEQAAPVGRVDQLAQLVGRAVGRVRRVHQHPVVAPAPVARPLADGHQLEHGDPELDEVVEPVDGREEGALAGERADMALVDDGGLPGRAGGLVAPLVFGDHHLGAAVHVADLRVRGRIVDQAPVGQGEAVGVAVARGDGHREPVVLGALHRMVDMLERERQRLAARRPEAERRAVGAGQRAPVQVRHRGLRPARRARRGRPRERVPRPRRRWWCRGSCSRPRRPPRARPAPRRPR